jgi:membrane protein
MLYSIGMVTKRSSFGHVGKSLAAAGRMMLNRETPRDAAGISYFSLVALFPAILVVIAVVDAFLGWMNLHKTVIQRIVSLFPGSRQFLRANLSDLTNPSTAVVLSCAVLVLWSSSLIFTVIESAINRAWGVPNQRTFWESRLRTVAFTLVLGASLLSSAGITAFVSAARARTASHITESARANFLIGWFWSCILLAAGFLIAVLVFAFLFKWTPHRKVLWREALPGALVSTIMWDIGSFIFVKLVPYFDYQKIYGRTGAVIALLAWVYTSNLIMLFGANFSAQLHGITLEQSSSESGTASGEKLRRFPSRR